MVRQSTTSADTGFRYWAFISYSHADTRWADWLQRSIERYRLPARMVLQSSETVPEVRRLFPVFRDRSDLPAAADLDSRLKEALSQSRNLVVICSPASASESRARFT